MRCAALIEQSRAKNSAEAVRRPAGADAGARRGIVGYDGAGLLSTENDQRALG